MGGIIPGYTSEEWTGKRSSDPQSQDSLREQKVGLIRASPLETNLDKPIHIGFPLSGVICYNSSRLGVSCYETKIILRVNLSDAEKSVTEVYTDRLSARKRFLNIVDSDINGETLSL